jgi:hypothetical protein
MHFIFSKENAYFAKIVKIVQCIKRNICNPPHPLD